MTITGTMEISVNNAGTPADNVLTSLLKSNAASDRDLNVTQIDQSNVSVIFAKGYLSYVGNNNDYQQIPQVLFNSGAVTGVSTESSTYYTFDISSLSGIYNVQTTGLGYLLTSTTNGHTISIMLAKL